MATVIVLTSGTSWTVPSDWNLSNNLIEGIGGGAAGLTGLGSSSTINGASGRDGGGAGAYAKLPNFAGTGSIAITIGQGGTVTGASGTDTSFNAGSLVAKAGTTSVGGLAASCTPTSGAQNGGSGGTGAAQAGGQGGGGGGGGGAAGSTGAGANGANAGAAPAAGAGGSQGTGELGGDAATSPGDGGAGGSGGVSPGDPGGSGSQGNLYGGGGGGGGGGARKSAACEPSTSGGAQGNGRQGVIVITYTAIAFPNMGIIFG